MNAAIEVLTEHLHYLRQQRLSLHRDEKKTKRILRRLKLGLPLESEHDHIPASLARCTCSQTGPNDCPTCQDLPF